MPRFYFHTDDGRRASHDENGIDLPSVDDVQREARELLRALVEAADVRASHTVVATICDVAGATVVRMTLSVTSERHVF